MSEGVIAASGIPVGIIPVSTFSPEKRKKDTFICFPENELPWNWVARAYTIKDGELIGPMYSFINTNLPLGGYKVVPGRGEKKPFNGIAADAVSKPVSKGNETKFLQEFIKTAMKGMILLEPELEPGHYYPRMWRGGYLHSEKKFPTYPLVIMTPYFDSFVASIRRFENLCKALKILFQTVQPSKENCSAYGDEIRSLIILACTETECQWRAILEANGYSKNILNTSDYVKLLNGLRLDKYQVSLSRYVHYPVFTPFKNWKSSCPTQSLDWYDAYNQLKHNAENKLNKAQLQFAVMAVAAVFVLLIAQFGISEVRGYLDDNTFSLEDFPRWPPENWYYEPVPREGWKEVYFDFQKQ